VQRGTTRDSGTSAGRAWRSPALRPELINPELIKGSPGRRTQKPARLAAQRAVVLRWIMSAGGVVIPQSQARRAIALPPGLVGETIRTTVTDTDRQLPQQHTHRHHPIPDTVPSAVTRSVTARIRVHSSPRRAPHLTAGARGIWRRARQSVQAPGTTDHRPQRGYAPVLRHLTSGMMNQDRIPRGQPADARAANDLAWFSGRRRVR
jgi:hypothetical protein